MQDVYSILEFHKIKEALSSFAVTALGKQSCLSLEILPKKELVEELSLLSSCAEAIDLHGTFPLSGGNDIGSFLALAEKGYILSIEEIRLVYVVLAGQKNLYSYAKKLEEGSLLQNWIYGCPLLKELYDLIGGIVSIDGEILDNASPELARIRKNKIKVKHQQEQMVSKLVEHYAPYLSDSTLTLRDGKYVLPVSLTYKNKVKGLALDISNSGESVFIEPIELVELDHRLLELEADEKKEIHRLLVMLSKAIANEKDTLIRLDHFIGRLDFIQAKIVYGETNHGSIASLSDDGSLFLAKARHPLLDQNNVVPNDFAFTSKQKVIVVSGPNAGGKTVALKTLGINALFFQCGLFVFATSGAIMPYFKHIFIDIGDAQSIEDNLSTFSGHMSNIASILRQIGGNDLVLLDEVGTGTSPKEGEALAISILEYILKKHSYAMCSSHFEGVKLFSLSHKEVGNACMLYDEEQLRPTYVLKMGLPGESYGLNVAKRFGLTEEVIARAEQILADQGDFSVSKAIAKLSQLAKENEVLKAKMESRERALIKKERELQVISKNLELRRERFMQSLEEEKREILEAAQKQVDDIIALLSNPDVKLHQAAEVKTKLRQLEATPEETHFDEAIEVGDYVKMPSLGIEGRVESIRGKNARVSTRAGKSFVLEVSLLQHATPAPREKAPINGSLLDAISDAPGLSLEVNLIGMRYDEAKAELDKYLDRCRQKGFKRVRIIHGYGSGTLRKMTQEYLAAHKNWVEKYEAAGEYEGGSGATVVYLK